MRYKFVVLLILIIIVGSMIYLLNFVLKKSFEKNFVFYELENKKLKLLVADEPKEWEQGLMFARNPVDFDGMIFLFPDKQIRYFWNKNTFVDLDVYWLDDDKIIGRDFLPSIEKTQEIKTIQSPASVNKVIEVIIKN